MLLKEKKSPNNENKGLVSVTEVAVPTYIAILMAESQDFLERGPITEYTFVTTVYSYLCDCFHVLSCHSKFNQNFT